MANIPPPGTLGEIIENAGNGQYGAVNLVLPLVSALANAPLSPTLVQVLGYNAANDGGGGFFEWAQGNTAAPDGGTVFTSNNSPGSPGPNLVTNGNFASGQTGWTVNAGTPSFTGGMASDNSGEFWQIEQNVTGLTIGVTYEISILYTLGVASGAYVAVNNHFNGTQTATPLTFSIVVTATSTSFLLVIGSQFAPATITNVFLGTAPGGRWLRVPQYPLTFVPEWFGAYGNDSNDDTAAIQACFNAAYNAIQASGVGNFSRSRVELSGGRMYKCLGSLTLDVTKTQLIGNGAVLDFAAQSSPGICIAITTEANPFDGNAMSLVENFTIFGNGAQTQTLMAVQGAQITFRRLYLCQGLCACDMSYGNVYLITFEDCTLRNSISGLKQIIASNANSGERMNFIGGTIVGCFYGVNWQNGAGELHISDASLDVCGSYIYVNGGYVAATDCHFESPKVTAFAGYNPFVCLEAGGSSLIRLIRPTFVWTGGNPAPVFINCTIPAPYGIMIEDATWGGGPGYEQGQTRLTNVPTVTTLNPGTSNPSLTLSNNDLTATGTHTGTSYQDISAALGQIGGDTNKTYFEVTFTSYNTTNTFSQANVGIALNDSSVGGGQNNAVWIDNPGSTGSSGVWTDGGQQTFSIPFPSRTTPFTIGCIVDRVNGKIAFTADGTTWSNSYSLSAGTGGVNISFLAGLVLYPQFGLASSGDSATINFGDQSFVYSGIVGSNSIFAWNAFLTVPGAGNVVIRGSISGNGTNSAQGASYPPLIDANNTWNDDFAFVNGSGSTFVDAWSLTQDTATITNRVTGTNLSITQNAAKPYVGFHNLTAAKAGNNATAAAFGLYLPVEQGNTAGIGIAYAASANSLGTFKINIKYVNINYYGAGGVPSVGASAVPYTNTFTPTTSYQILTWSPLNNPAPAWATHVLIEFDMGLMNAGSLYIGKCEVYQF